MLSTARTQTASSLPAWHLAKLVHHLRLPNCPGLPMRSNLRDKARLRPVSLGAQHAASETLYCGAPAKDDRWCAWHRRIVYAKPAAALRAHLSYRVGLS